MLPLSIEILLPLALLRLAENPIVSVETRDISDTESMSIVQYANSDVIVVKKAYSYTKLTNTGSSVSNVGTDKIGKASFQGQLHECAGVFKYQNVGFIITQSGSGNFTSYGSASTSGDIRIGSNSRSTTQINYALTFNYSSASKVYLEFSLYFSRWQADRLPWLITHQHTGTGKEAFL